MTLEFKQTCFACPEQYDVYDDFYQVGYVRLRNGTFTVTDETQSAVLFTRTFPLTKDDTLEPEELEMLCEHDYQPENIYHDGIFNDLTQRTVYLDIAERKIQENQ